MKSHDALFNWLQIMIVWEKRSSDKSAKETVLFFEKILREDHEIVDLQKEVEGDRYRIHFIQQGEEKTETFLRELAEKLLQDILGEPKYN